MCQTLTLNFHPYNITVIQKMKMNWGKIFCIGNCLRMIDNMHRHQCVSWLSLVAHLISLGIRVASEWHQSGMAVGWQKGELLMLCLVTHCIQFCLCINLIVIIIILIAMLKSLLSTQSASWATHLADPIVERRERRGMQEGSLGSATLSLWWGPWLWWFCWWSWWWCCYCCR